VKGHTKDHTRRRGSLIEKTQSASHRYGMPTYSDLPTTQALLGGKALTMLSNSKRCRPLSKKQERGKEPHVSERVPQMAVWRDVPDALETSLRLGPPAILFVMCVEDERPGNLRADGDVDFGRDEEFKDGNG
jgi:hypothetical protein